MKAALLVLDLPQGPDPQGHTIIKLGPWASRIEDPFLLAPPDIEPYPDSDAVKEACLRSLRAADLLMDAVVSKFPGEVEAASDLPKRFWEVFLSFYLVNVAGIVEDLRTRCLCLSTTPLVYGAPLNYVPEPPQEIGGYIERCLSRSALRISVMDACIRASLQISKENPIAYREDNPPPTQRSSWEIFPARVIMAGAKLLATVVSRSVKARALILPCQVSEVDLIRLSYIGLTPFRLNRRWCNILPVRADHGLRNRIFGDLPAPYSTVLARTFPVLALEGLSRSLKAGRRLIKDLSGKTQAVYMAEGWCMKEPMRAAIALLASEGAKVMAMQHGGGYGVYGVSPWTFTESKLSDCFISWGWKEQPSLLGGTPRIVPLPSPYLSHLASRPSRRIAWKVLLLVFSEDRYPKWLYGPIFPEMAHDYFRRQKILLDAFKSALPAAVKLYPREYGWHQNEYIASRYPEFTMLRRGRFVEWAMQARLCVVDYNATGFLELLAMGRPFLATWDRRWFRGTELFEQHLDHLLEVGVYYESPEALTKAYREIESSVESWWKEPARCRAVAAMGQQYARTSPDAFSEWRQFVSMETSRSRI